MKIRTERIVLTATSLMLAACALVFITTLLLIMKDMNSQQLSATAAVTATDIALPYYPNLVARTPVVEPEVLEFYSFNHAFVAHTDGEQGAEVIIRNHRGQRASAFFQPRQGKSHYELRWRYTGNDAKVPNPGELTKGPFVVTIKRGDKVIGRFKLDPLKTTDAFGPSFYAHVHDETDSYRPALALNGVAEYSTGREINRN